MPVTGAGHREVRRGRREGHEVTVGAECRSGARAVALDSPAGDAGARGGPRRAIVDEDVEGAVGVPGNQVRRGRVERDDAAIGAEPERGEAAAVAIALASVTRD